MRVTFGSVCSGIEAASVAWHPLGWGTAWLTEIDKAPAAVLAHHYPTAWNMGDMTALAPIIRAGSMSAPDVLVGGTPCQAFSIAGLRNSLSDARGQLTLSFVDLANAIDEKRDEPCVVVWENVPGVLNTKDNAFGCFLAALAGEDEALVPAGGKWSNAGCVYGPQRAIAWRVLDAQYFGVAQRRRRVFVVASARNGFDPATVLFECESVRRDSPPSREASQGLAGALTSSLGRRCGVPDGGDTTGYLQCFGGGNTSGPIDPAACLTARAMRLDFDVETFCTHGGSGVRRLTPTECERLQGFPDGYTQVPYRGKPMADGPRYKMLGNSMAVPCMAWIGRRIDAALRSAHNAP